MTIDQLINVWIACAIVNAFLAGVHHDLQHTTYKAAVWMILGPMFYPVVIGRCIRTLWDRHKKG